jgi:hypothetical protein
MDASGHLLVDFLVVQPAAIGDSPVFVDLKVSGGFELDPGLLPGLVAGLHALEKLARSLPNR